MTIPEHMIEHYADWVYRFRVDHPHDRDAAVLVCVRNRHVDGTWENEVLTTDGWHRYHEFEILPDNMPTMTGLDMRLDRSRQDEMVELIHEAFAANGAEDIRVDA